MDSLELAFFVNILRIAVPTRSSDCTMYHTIKPARFLPYGYRVDTLPEKDTRLLTVILLVVGKVTESDFNEEDTGSLVKRDAHQRMIALSEPYSPS